MQEDSLLPKGGPADQFKPVVPWPHVEGVEVDLNSLRLKHGETKKKKLSALQLFHTFHSVNADK